ncbi:MAG TPA: 4Fe-4S binding protein, partial [Fusibacter sp.]|nr:4Fe-4S binding protein [Fusibacter sp.]
VKRGDSVSALLIGALNRVPFSKWERKLARNVKINLNTCTRCEKCVLRCPVQNLRLEDGRIMQSCNCIICYRCVNLCPTKSISILSKKPPIMQYEGIAHLYE